MDANERGYVGATSKNKFNTDPNLNSEGDSDTWDDRNVAGTFPAQPDEILNVFIPPSESEDCDFNDTVLKYISEILMEEGGEEESCRFPESAALQAAEKSFYEALGEKFPSAPHHDQVANVENPDGSYAVNFSISGISTAMTDGYLFPNWNPDPGEYEAGEHVLAGGPSESTSQSSYSPSSCSSTISNSSMNFPDRTTGISCTFSDSETMMQFNKGVEEASKFLPAVHGFLDKMWPVELTGKLQVDASKASRINAEKNNSELFGDNSRGKKNPHCEDVNLQEGRKYKQPAVHSESTVDPKTLDIVLLGKGGINESSMQEVGQSGTIDNKSKVSCRKGSRARKQGGREDDVDLRGLLTQCAQAVAAEDIRTANEKLKQIRLHSSPTGDGMQRLAHYFAKGLEARVAGTGGQVKTFTALPASAADVLRAYQLYLASCPFRRISNFFSNKTIMNVSEGATRLHIIHFGILYGFQWPSFFQRLSSRPGGPPKLRITGIDIPRPGFRPAERIEETGRRLANYAETFKIPFEFNAIAQNWETVKIEDLKLEHGEVLVVNCLYRMRILYDETVMPSSPRGNNPRNTVLRLIKKINPDVFILGVVNGAYNAPFFITRFREALFHFFSLFDMLDANIPREMHERMLIERLMFGRQAMNVIACEGGERSERPETYKQWQIRNTRAGLRPLPLNEEIKKMARHHVKTSYHKDFVVDEDGHWLLQGWRGRILFALSTWKAAD